MNSISLTECIGAFEERPLDCGVFEIPSRIAAIGLSLECMDYIRAQNMFAPGARKLIYDMITHHATETSQQYQILSRLEKALALWGRYQDGIARACGIRHT